VRVNDGPLRQLLRVEFCNDSLDGLACDKRVHPLGVPVEREFHGVLRVQLLAVVARNDEGRRSVAILDQEPGILVGSITFEHQEIDLVRSHDRFEQFLAPAALIHVRDRQGVPHGRVVRSPTARER
jgi:hypothetical protein